MNNITCNLYIDKSTRIIYGESTNHKLTPTELRLMQVFIDHPEQNLSREYIIQEVWNTSFLSDTRLLQSHIIKLRKKLQDCRKGWSIETIWGWGYRLSRHITT